MWRCLGRVRKSERWLRSKHTEHIYEILKKYVLEKTTLTPQSFDLSYPYSLVMFGDDFTGFYVVRTMMVLRLTMLFREPDKSRPSTVSGSTFCFLVAQIAYHLGFPFLKVRVSFPRCS